MNRKDILKFIRKEYSESAYQNIGDISISFVNMCGVIYSTHVKDLLITNNCIEVLKCIKYYDTIFKGVDVSQKCDNYFTLEYDNIKEVF